jgi:GrpB-like predicted nucleotidyltransferase (UPF0157 family)
MSADWPAWALQVVEIEPPDPTWASLARDLVAALQRRLHPWLGGAIEHIGSTAVPGLPAKPVVDLMAPVTVLAACPAADPVLARAGWQLVPPELDERPWRRFYVLPEGDRRLAHLHLVEGTHPRWRDTITFRDALRAEPELAAAYAAVKRIAAEAHRDDREAYTTAKSAFVEQVTRRHR